jgi:hypothetical protein
MDTDQTIELTLEQDLSLRNFADLVQQMSGEQAREFLVEQQRLMNDVSGDIEARMEIRLRFCCSLI